jgi:hypothetical protein
MSDSEATSMLAVLHPVQLANTSKSWEADLAYLTQHLPQQFAPAMLQEVGVDLGPVTNCSRVGWQ